MNTVQPIRDMDTILDIARYLRSKSEREYVMFVTGIYSGLRISDILKLRVRDIRGKDHISIREKKTGKEKRFLINKNLKKILEEYTKGKDDLEYLLENPRTHKPITRQWAYEKSEKQARSLECIILELTRCVRHSGIICTRQQKMQQC